MLGYDQGELEGRSAFDLIPDDSTRKELQDYVEILVKEQPSRTPWFGKSKKKDGNIIDVQTDWNYKRDKEGRVTGFISIVTDISERVQAEKNIKRQARLLDLIFEHSLDSIVLLDKDYNFIRVSETYAKACQRESSEFPGHNHFEFYPSDLKDEVDEAKKGKYIYKKTARPFVFPDHPEWGTTYWNLGLVPILDKEGEIELFLFTLKDVTEQVQAEEALRGSEAKYRTLFEDSPISLWEEDFSAVKSFIDNLRDKGINDFRTYFEEHPEDLAHCAAMVKIVDINKATIDMYQVETKKEFLKGLSQFFTEETYELFKEEILSLCAGNTSFENKAINQTTTGEIKYIYMKCSLTPGQEETWSKMLVSIVDITDLKQAEEALRKSEAHLSALIQMLPDLVWLKDADGVYRSCNHRVECLFGAKEDEIVGKTDYDLVDKELADFLRENDRAAVAAGTVSVNEEEIAFADDGHVEILETLKTPMYDSEGNLIGVIGISRDITDRKQTEELLRKSEERFRTIADFTHDWEYWVAPDGRCLYVSPSCERITGYRSEDFVNDPGLLEKIVHPDDHSDIVDHVQGEEGLEKLHSVDFRIITRSGEERWINHVCQVVYGTNGVYLGRRGSNRDITKQKKMQNELLKAKKLESVGVLAGGIAHDFNNLMSVVMGNISLARTEMRPGSKGFKNLVEAEKASIQTTALTSRLITFSKGGGPVKEPVSIGDLVKDSVGSSLKGSDISCIFSVPEDILPVEVDEEQMKQVIHNITTNAQEATAEQGTINVSCGNVIIGEKDTLNLKDGKYVKISIEDQGPGIPKKDLINIFDPYFSTKEMGTQKGMGLGLAVSDSIVKKHDGLITVESKLGTGTTFSIYLPASEKEIVAATPVKKPAPEISESKGEKILVMDDEEVIRDVSNALLTHLGYEAAVAVDGVEAIELYKKAMESEKPFDMVILDLTNKIGMGGAEAMVNLLEIDPDVKAIVASGYSNDPLMSNFREHGFHAALPKPFNLDKLKEALHDAIAGE